MSNDCCSGVPIFPTHTYVREGNVTHIRILSDVKIIVILKSSSTNLLSLQLTCLTPGFPEFIKHSVKQLSQQTTADKTVCVWVCDEFCYDLWAGWLHCWGDSRHAPLVLTAGRPYTVCRVNPFCYNGSISYHLIYTD